jgi:hypothetical protein
VYEKRVGGGIFELTGEEATEWWEEFIRKRIVGKHLVKY